jgi:hypothetical protein
MRSRVVARGIRVATRCARVGWAVSSNSNNDLEDALERYCHAHPNAADSVEGVRQWWLTDPDVPLAEVEAALEALVKRGLLDVRWLLDGTAIYFNRAVRDQRD